MSSRRERQKNLYRQVDLVSPQRLQRVGRVVANDQTTRFSGHVRTISPRTWKIICIIIVVLLVLLFLTPKPQVPPGQDVQGASTSLEPISLNTVKTTIPPINPVQDNGSGKTFFEALKAK
ncbi:MAG: hypothetical protein Q8Q49_04480 [bacterium]|nr:hypothetical protein [bacterium]